MLSRGGWCRLKAYMQYSVGGGLKLQNPSVRTLLMTLNEIFSFYFFTFFFEEGQLFKAVNVSRKFIDWGEEEGGSNYLKLRGFSHSKKIKFPCCLGELHVGIALNLLKSALFIHTACMP